MVVTAVPDETYCLKTQRHSPCLTGRRIVCYRCGILLGFGQRESLGTLLDY
jgi:hypothetical protein